MAISHSSGIGRTRNSSVGIDRLRIDFDSNLRRWFGRNIGLWHSKRQYFFDEEKGINLEMYINVSKLIQSDLEFESYRFKWWCEDQKDFFIKKVCIGAKNKKKIKVGNINNYRDYSWITEIVKYIILASKQKPRDFIISAGKKLSGKEILEFAYKMNKLNYKKYYLIDNKFIRKNEDKILIGSSKNSEYLKNKYNFKFKIFGKRLIKEMYNSL